MLNIQERPLTSEELNETTRIFYISLMTQLLKDRQVRSVKIGQYEVRTYQEHDGMKQHVTLYKMETFISEMTLTTNDNINVVSYMIQNNEVARMFIRQAILKCSRSELVESVKRYGYELKL